MARNTVNRFLWQYAMARNIVKSIYHTASKMKMVVSKTAWGLRSHKPATIWGMKSDMRLIGYGYPGCLMNHKNIYVYQQTGNEHPISSSRNPNYRPVYKFTHHFLYNTAVYTFNKIRLYPKWHLQCMGKGMKIAAMWPLMKNLLA